MIQSNLLPEMEVSSLHLLLKETALTASLTNLSTDTLCFRHAGIYVTFENFPASYSSHCFLYIGLCMSCMPVAASFAERR